MFCINNIEITKREILVSIVIFCVLLTTGFVISGHINNSLMDKEQEYNTAAQIDGDKDLFEYGMRTNIGNAFVYGDLKAIDSVTYKEIGGNYSYIEKVKEEYTMHTRIVTKTKTNANGEIETHTEEEVYYTWDEVERESKHCTQISFLDVSFTYGTIPLPTHIYIDTIEESSDIRYKYYGCSAELNGTIYTSLYNNTINDAEFYENLSIEETKEKLCSKVGLVVFWIAWILLMIGVIIGFYALENKWLEDN